MTIPTGENDLDICGVTSTQAVGYAWYQVNDGFLPAYGPACLWSAPGGAATVLSNGGEVLGTNGSYQVGYQGNRMFRSSVA
jgi:hypothetical protein